MSPVRILLPGMTEPWTPPPPCGICVNRGRRPGMPAHAPDEHWADPETGDEMIVAAGSTWPDGYATIAQIAERMPDGVTILWYRPEARKV